jgi:hypothetical protein
MVNTDGTRTIANGAGDPAPWDGQAKRLKQRDDLTTAQVRARTFGEIWLALEARDLLVYDANNALFNALCEIEDNC